VVSVIEQAGSTIADIERIVCGAGPGSFTSLRIAASIAKGIEVGRHLPLYAVSSLALAVAATAPADECRYLAVLDALRGESYAQLVTVTAGGAVAVERSPIVVPTPELGVLAERLDARPVGAAQVAAWQPHAKGAWRLFQQVEGAGPVPVSSWEPEYGRQAEAQSRWEAVHGRPLRA
jgi:tRNA threonylcarbamoyladenosine biosynthesis protein TsaB